MLGFSTANRRGAGEVSWWALGTSLIPCFFGVPGVILGVVALRRVSKEHPDQRRFIRGVAWIAIVISALMAASMVAFLMIPQGVDKKLEDLKVGQCIDTVPQDPRPRVTVVDCSREHQGEVFAIIDRPEEVVDDERVDQILGKFCTQKFPGYVGAPVDETSYTVMHLYSSESPLIRSKAGAVCLIVSGSDTGSAKDSGPDAPL